MRKFFLSILLLFICTTALSNYRTEAEKLFNKGKYIEAGAYFVKCAKNEEMAKAPRKDIILQCYKDASYCYYTVKIYNKALEIMEETLAWSKRNQNKKETAESYLNKGSILFKLNRYRDALKCYEKALLLFKELDEPTDIARCMNKLSSMLILMEKFSEASTFLDRSLQIYTDGKKDGEIAETNNINGDLFFAQGFYSKAENSYKKALKYHMELFDLQNSGLLYGKLGDLSTKTGAYNQALSYYSTAAIVYQDSKNIREATLQLFKIAQFHIKKGKTKKAFSFFKPFLISKKTKKGKRIKKIDPEIVYYASIGMGDIKKSEKSYSKSLYHYLRALDITPKFISYENKANLLVKIGETFALSENYDSALSFYEDANNKLSVYDGSIRRTKLLNKMGILAFSFKFYDSALNYFEVALRINRNNPVIKSLFLARIGEIYFLKNDTYLSEKFLLDATSIQENYLNIEKDKNIKLYKSYKKSNEYLYILNSKKSLKKSITYLKRSGDLPENCTIENLKEIATANTILYYKTIEGIEDIFHRKSMTNFLLIINKDTIKGYRIKTFEVESRDFKVKKSSEIKGNIKIFFNHKKTDNLMFLTSLYKKKDNDKHIRENSKLINIIEKKLYTILIKPIEDELYGINQITIIPSPHLEGLSFENFKSKNEPFGKNMKIFYEATLSSMLEGEKSKSKAKKKVLKKKRE